MCDLTTMLGLTVRRDSARNLIAAAILIASAGAAFGQTAASANPVTMASLLAEGYEMQTVQVFRDKIWLRKAQAATAYICDRGRLGSPTFDAYRSGRYDQVLCSPVP